MKRSAEKIIAVAGIALLSSPAWVMAQQTEEPGNIANASKLSVSKDSDVQPNMVRPPAPMVSKEELRNTVRAEDNESFDRGKQEQQAIEYADKPQDVAWLGQPEKHMIAIEALVIEINEERTRDLGLSYGVNQLQKNPTGEGVIDTAGIFDGADVTLGRALAPVRVPALIKDLEGMTDIKYESRRAGANIDLSGMQIDDNVISARLQALLNTGDASIRTRSVAIALHGTNANIRTTENVPYLDINAKNQLAVRFEEVGVIMDIVPRIESLTKRDTILDIKNLEVSSVSSFMTESNVNRPVFTTSNTQTKVSMREDETLVIGGLKSRQVISQDQRVPILGHIPVVNWLFKSESQQERIVDVLFFITPHILEPGQNVLLPYDFENQRALGMAYGLPERPAGSSNSPGDTLPGINVETSDLIPTISQ